MNATISNATHAEWAEGNNDGDGFAIGRPGDTVTQAAQGEGWEILDTDDTGCVLALSKYGKTYLVCPYDGPMAGSAASQSSPPVAVEVSP